MTSKKLLLFIHGLGGDNTNWGAFPQLIDADIEIASVYDHICFSYRTDKVPGLGYLRTLLSKFIPSLSPTIQRIQRIAELLGTNIKTQYVDYSEIVLVCHSMGGLVAQKYLTDVIRKKQPTKVTKMLLYAVPNTGSDLAKIVKIICLANRQVQQLTSNSEFLETLNQDWHTLECDKQVETLYVAGMHDIIVDRQSAGRYWGQDIEVVEKDHKTIVKPLDAKDLSFLILKRFVLSTSKTIASPLDKKVIIDIGKITLPGNSLKNAEVRFTLTNALFDSVKITSVKLTIVRCEEYSIPGTQYVAAPVDEHFLYANMTPNIHEYELFERHHILHQNESDGFFLKIDADEGFIYTMKLIASYHPLGNMESLHTANSNEFIVPYPIKTIEGLKKLLNDNNE